ncbi:hypothetical protein N1851_000459 [Merluccius polli]|uniref:Uncharacterized protein n=1 Tax=Merluccius polli TaxID=89951 RepID=A0AA47PDX6_MERPO|nr:hypothetical protein N1851_000459 [Merluccius polli]
MTLGTVPDTGTGTGIGTGTGSSGDFCSCCGAKIVPYFSHDAVVSQNQINQLCTGKLYTVEVPFVFLWAFKEE